MELGKRLGATRAGACLLMAFALWGCGLTSRNAPGVGITEEGGGAASGGRPANTTGATGETSAAATSGKGEVTGGSTTEAGGAAGTTQTAEAGAGGAEEPQKPAAGCGLAPPQNPGAFVRHTLFTSGVKDQNCADKLSTGQPVCGPWSLEREYYLWLPPNYDSTRRYPLVLEGPRCGSTGTDVYSLAIGDGPDAVGLGGNVIRVGLTPPPSSVGHPTNPDQGCFDDKEGDDSVDFVFYEALLDQLKTEICYDEDRVLAVGVGSGGWLANELACKYAGDPNGHALRGVVTYRGGLPFEEQYRPTCSNQAFGVIMLNEFDPEQPEQVDTGFAGPQAIISNGCPVESRTLGDFSIGATKAPTACRQLLLCSSKDPVVSCSISLVDGSNHDEVVSAAFATLVQQLAPR